MDRAILKTIEIVNEKNCRYFLRCSDVENIALNMGGWKNKSEIIEHIEDYALWNMLPKI